MPSIVPLSRPLLLERQGAEGQRARGRVAGISGLQLPETPVPFTTMPHSPTIVQPLPHRFLGIPTITVHALDNLMKLVASSSTQSVGPCPSWCGGNTVLYQK